MNAFHLDVNECSLDGLNNCHGDANCSDTPGSFECSCLAGYRGNGTECYGTLTI